MFGGITGSGGGGEGGIGDNVWNFAGLIQALEDDSLVQILSQPTLTAFSGQRCGAP